MIGTQDMNARKFKKSGEQLYCGCGETILRGTYCPSCKVKAMAKSRIKQQNKAKEKRKNGKIK